jgi:hypothetical protein
VKRTVSVRIADLEPPTIGEWCDRCLLPTVAVWSLLTEVNGRPDGVIVIGVCLECGAEL